MNDFIIPLADEIFFVKGERNGKLPYSNSLLVGNYLIDTGVSRKHLRKLRKEFQIKNVCLTHWHEDHVRDNEMLAGARFLCHPLDKQVIENTKRFIDYYCVEKTPSEPLFKQYLFEILKIHDTRIDKTIEDGDIVKIGNSIHLKVIHSPGHSAGHCCFYESESRIGFLADIDLSSFGPWYGGLDSNLIHFEESINSLINLDIDIAITGHNGMVEGRKNIKERLLAYKSIISKREDKILHHISEKKIFSIRDLTHKNIIYRSYNDVFSEYLHVAEKMMLQKHFDKFLENGIFEQTEKGYVMI